MANLSNGRWLPFGASQWGKAEYRLIVGGRLLSTSLPLKSSSFVYFATPLVVGICADSGFARHVA